MSQLYLDRVPTESIAAMGVALLLSVIAPLVVTIVLLAKKKIRFVPFLVGIAIFVPCLIIAVLTSQIAAKLITNVMVLYSVLALRAGLVEETGRLLAFKFLLKKYDRFPDGVAYGIGHGWCEAGLMLGLNYISYITVSLMYNSGVLTGLPGVTPEAIQPLIGVLIGTAPGDFLLSGWERISAMVFHLSASLIVFYAVRTKKYGFYILSILLHTAFNCLALPMVSGRMTLWQGELLLSAAALVILALALVITKPLRTKTEANDGNEFQS